MNPTPSSRLARLGRPLLLAMGLGALGLGTPGTMDAQTRSTAPLRPMPSGVLGDVPLTPEDLVAQQLVQRLDFDNYRALIRGLADFGDREQGTERNDRANDWIEAQLRSWGYEVERHHYTFRGEPRQQVYATKIGSSDPGSMYIIGGHMDGRGGGEAVNDNASGTALVMEIARVLAGADVRTESSVRFILWNNEETGLDGARAYVEDRAPLQGIEEPVGSGRYPEPRWLGKIQHDKVMFDHGNPVQYDQVLNADVDVEYQLASEQWEASAHLGIALINASRKFSTDYPAALSNAMANTDSMPFMDLVPAVSVRENRRRYEIGRGSDPHWHQPTDLYVNYSEADFRLGFNATQMTLGATALLAGARLVP
jgi:hypothetical protein